MTLKKRMTNLPLQTKIGLVIVLLNFILVSVILLVGVNFIINTNSKMLYKTQASLLTNATHELDITLQNYETVTSAIITDTVIQTHLYTLQHYPDNSIARVYAFSDINTRLQIYKEQFTSKDVLFLYVQNPLLSVSTNTLISNTYDPQILEDINEQVSSSNENILYTIVDQTLFISRPIRNITPFTLEYTGVFTVALDLGNIVSRSTNFENEFTGLYYMLLDNEEILYSSFESEIIEQKAINITDKYEIIEQDNAFYFAVKGNISGQDWQYISLIDYSDTQNAITYSKFIFVIILILGLILSIVFCNNIIKRMLVHIDKLLLKMNKFAQDKKLVLENDHQYDDRYDEVGLLHKGFDKMANDIHALIQKEYINEILVKDAQIKELESQIDPHFLYNVLATINWRAKVIGEKDISLMVESLSNLMRETLNTKAECITLKQELALVNSYLTIQKIRFEDQISFSVNAKDEHLNVLLPKLIIQPLIENAIHYAKRQSIDECYIEVETKNEDDILEIFVKNTGSQFPENFKDKLENNKINVTGNGIGLLNIHKRLKLTFGEQYGLDFYNEDGKAIVVITLPFYSNED